MFHYLWRRPHHGSKFVNKIKLNNLFFKYLSFLLKLFYYLHQPFFHTLKCLFIIFLYGDDALNHLRLLVRLNPDDFCSNLFHFLKIILFFFFNFWRIVSVDACARAKLTHLAPPVFWPLFKGKKKQSEHSLKCIFLN